ncbi:phosphatidylinositol mannoside acyltransferase [Oryzihumus sp.]|uniref:phosphatidylinositol mannoside acyltransferase n=1 Tax=Oryzihumus sp. TaxID=1968903 RepID=UPI002ED92BF0
MSRLTDRAGLTAYRAGWSLVRRLPERVAYAVFDLIAVVAARRGGSGVARMRANYARVRPELDAAGLDALVRAGMRSYLRYWCEAFRLPDLTEADLVARVRTVGDAPVRAHLGAGRPAVMFLGHMGNWDLAGAWSTTQLAPVTTVAERLRPEELYDEFLGFRERLGMRILPLTGGSDVFRELTTALRASAFVALLADRDLTAGGVEVDFCGHRARMAVGPAALAVTTGAALHPVSVHYERRATGRGYELVIVFHDRVEVPASGTTRDKVATMTQACADALTAAVREHTEDWHMMQRVFVEDLDPARTPVASAEGAS